MSAWLAAALAALRLLFAALAFWRRREDRAAGAAEARAEGDRAALGRARRADEVVDDLRRAGDDDLDDGLRHPLDRRGARRSD